MKMGRQVAKLPTEDEGTLFLSVNNVTAVDVEDLTSHIRRVVRSQEHIGRRKFIGLTGTLHRYLLAKLLNLFFGHGLHNQECTNSNILFFLSYEEFLEAS